MGPLPANQSDSLPAAAFSKSCQVGSLTVTSVGDREYLKGSMVQLSFVGKLEEAHPESTYQTQSTWLLASGPISLCYVFMYQVCTYISLMFHIDPFLVSQRAAKITHMSTGGRQCVRTCSTVYTTPPGPLFKAVRPCSTVYTTPPRPFFKARPLRSVWCISVPKWQVFGQISTRSLQSRPLRDKHSSRRGALEL